MFPCSRLFTIVHHCSALFSKKIWFLSQRPLSVHTGNAQSVRVTNHGFFRRRCTRDAQSETPARTAAPAVLSLLSCALWRGMGRLWRGMGGRRPPAPATRPVGFSAATNHATWFFPCPPAAPGRATPSPTSGFFTRHETRDTNHGFFLACCGRGVVRNAGQEGTDFVSAVKLLEIEHLEVLPAGASGLETLR